MLCDMFIHNLQLPSTVIYSLPEPPPTSCTALVPLFVSTNLEATAVQNPVSSQFHTLCPMSFWSNFVIPEVSNKCCTFRNHSSKTAGSFASALFLERCWGFLYASCGFCLRNPFHQFLPGKPDSPKAFGFPCCLR